MPNRDQRFVAVHRGGTLEKDQHAMMASWAADCAEHVLPLFEACSRDDRPRRAISAARAWAKDKVSVGEARDAAFASHAAARAVSAKHSIAVARASGHAAATAHMADHCMAAAYYALRAISADGSFTTAEAEWQIDRLPDAIRSLVESGLCRKYPREYEPITSEP